MSYKYDQLDDNIKCLVRGILKEYKIDVNMSDMFYSYAEYFIKYGYSTNNFRLKCVTETYEHFYRIPSFDGHTVYIEDAFSYHARNLELLIDMGKNFLYISFSFYA